MKVGIGVIGMDMGKIGRFALSFWNNIESSDSYTTAQFCLNVGNSRDHREVERLGFPVSVPELPLNDIFQAIEYIITFNNTNADVIFIFSELHSLVMPGLVPRALYFFENNPTSQLCTFPLLPEKGLNDNDPRWVDKPRRVYTLHGRPLAINLRNFPKGFSFEAITNTYPIFCLPWPPVRSELPEVEDREESLMVQEVEVCFLDKFGNPQNVKA